MCVEKLGEDGNYYLNNETTINSVFLNDILFNKIPRRNFVPENSCFVAKASVHEHFTDIYRQKHKKRYGFITLPEIQRFLTKMLLHSRPAEEIDEMKSLLDLFPTMEPKQRIIYYHSRVG